MATTVLARSTVVPTDRDITVKIRRVDAASRQPAPGGDMDRNAMLAGYRAEMSRHMAVTGSLLKTNKTLGLITSADFSFFGRPVRPWTRAELEAQLRYLGLAFDSITITHESGAAAPRESVGRSFLRGLPGVGPALATGAAGAEMTLDGALAETPMEMDRRPMIAAIAAVVLGLAVLIGVMVWGGK